VNRLAVRRKLEKNLRRKKDGTDGEKEGDGLGNYRNKGGNGKTLAKGNERHGGGGRQISGSMGPKAVEHGRSEGFGGVQREGGGALGLPALISGPLDIGVLALADSFELCVLKVRRGGSYLGSSWLTDKGSSNPEIHVCDTGLTQNFAQKPTRL